MFSLFLVVAVFHLSNSLAQAACTVSVNGGLGEPQPLVLISNGATGMDAFYLPVDTAGNIPFSTGESALLACPGSQLLVGGGSIGVAEASATCSSGSSFTISGQTVAFSSITCSSYPAETARYTGASCLGSRREIEIGFQISTKFIQIMSICFDDVAQTSWYSSFTLPSAIGGYQSGFPRPSWIDDNFFSVGSSGPDFLYTRVEQRATINAILGLSPTDVTYIKDNDYFLSRGHFAAKAGFVYGTQQRATFHMVNVGPQWQTFNAANWGTVEQNTRDYASSRGVDLIVYSGIYGVTTLPDVNGIEQELYLYVNGGSRGLPVPEIYWKIVYNPSSQAGVAIIGVNNPYHTVKTTLCNDISGSISWLTWSPNDMAMGYGYCCTVDDLRSVASTVPTNFPVSGLLT